MTKQISLRRTTREDLDTLFLFQRDPEACYLAAFTSKDPDDKEAYINKYAKFIDDPSIHMCTIRLEDKIIGSISKFVLFDEAEITYWIDKPYWGQGYGTDALTRFLQIEPTRPLKGRTAFDNY